MSTNTVSQRVEFDCVYILKDIQGLRTLQGCRYLVEATVSRAATAQTESGVIIDFQQLKQYMIASVPSHKFLYYHADADAAVIAAGLAAMGISVEAYGVPVCAENICFNIAAKLQSSLDIYQGGLVVTEVKLRENSDSFATYLAK